MLTVIKNEEFLIAACEWCRCDKDGTRNSEGKYIWISELEIGKSFSKDWIIKEVIKEIDKKAGNATHVYFLRAKYNKRIRVYKRERFLEFAK